MNIHTQRKEKQMFQNAQLLRVFQNSLHYSWIFSTKLEFFPNYKLNLFNGVSEKCWVFGLCLIFHPSLCACTDLRSCPQLHFLSWWPFSSYNRGKQKQEMPSAYQVYLCSRYSLWYHAYCYLEPTFRSMKWVGFHHFPWEISFVKCHLLKWRPCLKCFLSGAPN